MAGSVFKSFLFGFFFSYKQTEYSFSPQKSLHAEIIQYTHLICFKQPTAYSLTYWSG